MTYLGPVVLGEQSRKGAQDCLTTKSSFWSLDEAFLLSEPLRDAGIPLLRALLPLPAGHL